MTDIRQRCVEAYSRHKKLKLVGDEVGIPWQSVYVHLRAAGVPVTGDKSRHGSDKDRLAAKAEAEFERLVPYADNMNRQQFQAKIDFKVGHLGVDVKAATSRRYGRTESMRWAFGLKQHQMQADFLVCFGYEPTLSNSYAVFLIPGELVRDTQTISIPLMRCSKWQDYVISASDLKPFFDALLAN